MRQIMAKTNKGGATTFTTPSDREIITTRVFDSPRRLVFEAWTNPEHVPHWMLGPGIGLEDEPARRVDDARDDELPIRRRRERRGAAPIIRGHDPSPAP